MRSQQTAKRSKEQRGGFTLLELMVVITIIGLLASIVLVSTRGIGPRARQAKAKADVRAIHSVAVALYNETGVWPESIAAMVNAKDEKGMPAIASLDEEPKDPYGGQDYNYDPETGVVTCLGPDHTLGTEDDIRWPPGENQ